MTFRRTFVAATIATLLVTVAPGQAHAAPTAPEEKSEATGTAPEAPVSRARLLSLAAASAHPCGSRCDGKDPETYIGYQPPGGPSAWRNCAGDARTVASQRTGGSLWVELRYSPRCRTAWARSNIVTAPEGWPVNTWVYSFRADGSFRKEVGIVDRNSDRAWTGMVNDAGLTAQGVLYVGGYFYTDKY